MVKLVQGPTTAIVQAYKKRIDFYVVNGQHRARAWPQWRMTTRSPRVVLQQPWLAAANAAYLLRGPYTAWCHDLWAKSGTFTARDIHHKLYFGTMPSPIGEALAPCTHETPFPDPDPNHHYWHLRGLRHRFTPAQDHYLEFKPEPFVPLRILYKWCSYADHPPWHVFPVKYTRRGITYTGCDALRYDGLLDVAYPTLVDGDFYRWDITSMYGQSPKNYIYMTVQSWSGDTPCDRQAFSPLMRKYLWWWDNPYGRDIFAYPPNLSWPWWYNWMTWWEQSNWSAYNDTWL